MSDQTPQDRADESEPGTSELPLGDAGTPTAKPPRKKAAPRKATARRTTPRKAVGKKATAEQAPAGRTTDEPTTDEPTTDEPTTDEPTTAPDVAVQDQPASSTPSTTPPPVDPETTESASAETAAAVPAGGAAPAEEAAPAEAAAPADADGAQEPAAEPDPEHSKAVARQVRDAENHAAGEIPSFDVTLKIRRYDPEVAPEPRWEEFTVTVHGTDRLLDALHKVKWEQDGSLTFRRSCAHGVCGSDAMRINGRNRLACKTLCKDLNPDKPIVVEPIKGLPVEKDLVVDMEPFFQSYREVMPFLVTTGHEPTRERIQSQADRERFDDTTKCILCAACTSSCPVFWTDGQYFGPAAIVNAHRFIFDSRDEGSDLRLEILNDREGVWRCRTTFNCTEACPRGIEVTKAIQEVKRALLTRKV